MSLPDSVKVGPHIYTVESSEAAVDRVCHKHQRELDGCADHQYQLITISPNGADSYRKDVFLHEVLHAVITATAMEFEQEDGEERLVGAMSTMLLQVIRDNPEVIRWLSQHEQSEI